jgi:hypothetical protein
MQAEAKPPQQATDQFLAGGEAKLGQRLHKVPAAPADHNSAASGTPRIADCTSGSSASREPWLSLDLRPAAAPRSTNAACQLGILAPQLRKTTPERNACDPGRLGHRRDAASTCRISLGCREQPPRALVEIGRKRLEAHLDLMARTSVIQVYSVSSATESDPSRPRPGL